MHFITELFIELLAVVSFDSRLLIYHMNMIDVFTTVTDLNNTDALGAYVLKITAFRFCRSVWYCRISGPSMPSPWGECGLCNFLHGGWLKLCLNIFSDEGVIEVRGRRLVMLSNLHGAEFVVGALWLLAHFHHHLYKLIFIIPILKMKKLSLNRLN